MYVRAAAERSLSGTPMHLLLVDAPNHAVPINGMFHARLEPLRAFVSSYPIDGILRISEKCGRPINGILSDTPSAFTDQPRLCCRKHRAYNTIRVFEQWSSSNLAFADRDATAQVPPAPLSPLLLPTSAAPYFLRSSNPSVNFFARPSARTVPFLLDFPETFFHRPPSCVFFFGRLQYRLFLDNFKTVWPSGDLYHNLRIFLNGLSFLLGTCSPLQILFVMGAYCFLFPFSIFFCVYQFDPWMDHDLFFSIYMWYCILHVSFIW